MMCTSCFNIEVLCILPVEYKVLYDFYNVQQLFPQNSISRSVMETRYVPIELKTEFLNSVQMNCMLQRL